MDIDALKAGLYSVVNADVPGLTTPDNPMVMPVPPTFVVYDFNITTHRTMTFFSELDMTARLVISRADLDQGGKSLRGYMGDAQGSIFYAIAKPYILKTGVQTFNGSCTQAIVTSIRGYRQYNYGNVPFVGCEFVIHCIGERATP